MQSNFTKVFYKSILHTYYINPISQKYFTHTYYIHPILLKMNSIKLSSTNKRVQIVSRTAFVPDCALLCLPYSDIL